MNTQFENGSTPAVFGQRLRFAAMLFVGLATGPISTQAKIITLFNFNDMATNNDGTTAASIDNAAGTPTLTLVEESGPLVDLNGQGGASFIDPDGTSHSAGMSAAWTTGILNTSADPNDTWLLQLDTTGYVDLQLRFDYRLTDAVFQGDALRGPSQLTLEWSVGGGGFSTIQTFPLNVNNSYNEFVIDLSAIAAIESAADVSLRGTWSNDGSETIVGGTAPSVRMDNFQVTGVPEPASLVLLIGAGIALGARLRR
jgi:hypothetical protein